LLHNKSKKCNEKNEKNTKRQSNREAQIATKTIKEAKIM
jgi:hypothetical protein